MRLACQRHIDDLKDGFKRGLSFDAAAADHAILFFEKYLVLAEGEHEGQPFILSDFQKFIVGSLFGWKGQDGYRRFRTAYIEIGKGSGKSPMAAGIGLYCLIADGENAAEVYSAATIKDQAKILFRDAENMVAASPFLSKRIESNVNNLSAAATNSFFRPISSEKKALDGKRVHCALLDEVHEHPSAIVVDKMRAGTKGRRQALIVEITNSGHNRHSVCYHHHQYSEQVLTGLIPKKSSDSWFAYVCMLDLCADCQAAGKNAPSCEECDQWTDEKVWIKANPNLGVSIPMKYLREQVAEAIGMPSKANLVQRLNFCIWTEQAIRWLPMDKWDSCSGAVSEAEIRTGIQGYAGLDLASTIDIGAFVRAFPVEEEHRGNKRTNYLVKATFWIPEENIAARVKRDRVPYDQWVKEGLVIATEGNVIDYDRIRKEINAIADRENLKEIGYDPWNATQIANQLMQDGFNVVPMRQGMQTLTEPSKELEKLVTGGMLVHGGNQVLRWMASNVSVISDSNGNIRPDKEASTEKIDGIVALIMALGRAIANAEGESVYGERGVLVV